MAVSDWSTTAADNNAAPPAGAPEGQTPGSLNNCIRQIMADVRSFYDGANTTNDSAANVGFKGLPQTVQSGNYTLVLSDAGKHISYQGSGGHTLTIPANASVAYPIGTVLTFVHNGSGALSIGITSDSLFLAATASTGTRSLAVLGIASALKTNTTSWVISGTGLS